MFGKQKLTFLMSLVTLASFAGCSDTKKPVDNKAVHVEVDEDMNNLVKISIIVGSTREGRTSEKVARQIESMASKRTDVAIKVIDLNDFNLPMLYEETAPARRKEITDPIIQKWSDGIKEQDAFIIVVPEYNAGYPGVLKNALDLLYVEWNDKPVGFVGHSGGPSGASSAVEQLRKVAMALKMMPVATSIAIGNSWKAFDAQGNLVDVTIEQKLNQMIDQIISARNVSKE